MKAWSSGGEGHFERLRIWPLVYKEERNRTKETELHRKRLLGSGREDKKGVGRRRREKPGFFLMERTRGGEFLGDTISECCVLTNNHFETGVGEEWLLGSHLEDW